MLKNMYLLLPSFDFVVASPNTFSNVQGFRFKDDSVSNEIISDIENNIPVLNGSRIYKKHFG